MANLITEVTDYSLTSAIATKSAAMTVIIVGTMQHCYSHLMASRLLGAAGGARLPRSCYSLVAGATAGVADFDHWHCFVALEDHQAGHSCAHTLSTRGKLPLYCLLDHLLLLHSWMMRTVASDCCISEDCLGRGCCCLQLAAASGYL